MSSQPDRTEREGVEQAGPREGPARRRTVWRLCIYLALGLGLLELLALLLEGTLIEPIVTTAEQAAYKDAGMLIHSDRPELSFQNRPHARVAAAGHEYRHDARGFRLLADGETQDVSDEKPVVAFLGDSTTYGWGSAAEETIPARVGKELGGSIRPLNMGVSGYHTGQEVALYERFRNNLDGASAVVVLLFPNDFTRGVFSWDPHRKWLYMDLLPLPRALKPWLMHSALYRVVMGWHSQRARRGSRFDPSHPDNWDLVAGHLGRLAALVKEDGRSLLVAHLPALETVEPYPYADAVRHVAELCARRQIPFIDLRPALVAEADSQARAYEAGSGEQVSEELLSGRLSVFWLRQDDHHLNAAGNRVAARALAPAVGMLLGGARESEQAPWERPLAISVRPLKSRRSGHEFESEFMSALLARVGGVTGLEFGVDRPADLARQLERMADGSADLFLLGPMTYLIGRQRYAIEPLWAATKRGGSPYYRVAIIARADSGIDRLADLRERSFLFDEEEEAHPLRRLLAIDLLARSGFRPVNGGPSWRIPGLRVLEDRPVSRIDVVRRVVAGDADAGCTWYSADTTDGVVSDGRGALLADYPLILDRVKILAVSEAVPYPLIAVRGDLPENVRQQLLPALERVLMEEGGELVARIGGQKDRHGFVPIGDGAFDGLRRVLKRLGKSPEALLERDDDTY